MTAFETEFYSKNQATYSLSLFPHMCGRHLWKSGPLMSHVFVATARLIQATFAFAGSSDETGSVLSVYHRRFESIWVASVLFWLWA